MKLQEIEIVEEMQLMISLGSGHEIKWLWWWWSRYWKRGNHVTERPKHWKDFLQKESAMDKEKRWGRTFQAHRAA